MKPIPPIFISMLLILWFPLYSQNDIRHSFFIAGPQFTGFIGEKGEEIWNSGKPGARDGYVLPNGHILICWADEVIEYSRKKNIVFQYKRASPDMELGTAVRLKNGNTLITESGMKPRLIEVDKKAAIKITVPLEPETENTHMQTRMARKLESGNYLVPHLLAFAVKEYSPKGNIIKVFKTDIPEIGSREGKNWPFTAIRLSNGNTLVSLTNGNKVVEFNDVGKVVWKVTNEDLKEDLLHDPCGIQRLPNGNTVIASYGAKTGVKLFEITRDYQVVWKYTNYNAHEFQLLTTNGSQIKGALLK